MVRQARGQLYNRTGAKPKEFYPQLHLQEQQQQQTQKLYMDATPDLLHMPNMTKHLLCVTPWVKLVVILRNPVKRAFSDYEFNFQGINSQRRHKKLPEVKRYPFEVAFKRDMTLLKEAGGVSDCYYYYYNYNYTYKNC
jgi:hypothetical protein